MEHAACRQCGSPDTAAIASYQAFAHAAAAATDERKPLHAYICAHPETAFTQFIGCRHCDFIRIDPLPTATTLMRFYQNYYGGLCRETRQKNPPHLKAPEEAHAL